MSDFLYSKQTQEQLQGHLNSLILLQSSKEKLDPSVVEAALSRVPNHIVNALRAGRPGVCQEMSTNQQSQNPVIKETQPSEYTPERLAILKEEERKLQDELNRLESETVGFHKELLSSKDDLLKQKKEVVKKYDEMNVIEAELQELQSQLVARKVEYNHLLKVEFPRLKQISILDYNFEVTYSEKDDVGFLCNTPFGVDPQYKDKIDWPQTNACCLQPL